MWSCHLRVRTILLPPLQFYAFYFFFSLHYWTPLIKVYKTYTRSGKSGKTRPDLALRGEMFSSFTIKYVANCRCLFSGWGSFLLFYVCWEVLSWMSVEFCHMSFLLLWRWSRFFFFILLNCIKMYSNVTLTLHSWNKPYLINPIL